MVPEAIRHGEAIQEEEVRWRQRFRGSLLARVVDARQARQSSSAAIEWLWAFVLLAAGCPDLPAGPERPDSFGMTPRSDLTNNAVVIGPLGLKEIWTTSRARICRTLVWLSTFWFEHKLWGLTPWPYHLVVVLEHATSGVVLWRLLRLLQVPGALLGAALWALHPVQVETVAWVTETKNTESCLFYLLAILFFAKDLKAEKPVWSAQAWNWNYTLLTLRIRRAGHGE